MQRIDFENDAFDGVFERSYDEPAAGWVDGAYVRRVASERPVAFAPVQGGLPMRGSRLVEESDALNGDPNTIARTSYYRGTTVRLACAARDYHLAVELTGAAHDQRVALVVNGESRVRFTLAANMDRTVELDVPLTKRELELTFVAADGLDDASAGEAELSLRALTLTEIRHVPAASPRILIAADSTVQTYFDEERPQSGWGEWLYWYLFEGHVATVAHDETSAVNQARMFSGNGPTIYNKALGGRGFRTYTAEHRFERLLGVLRPGDAVVVQFGLNDASKNRPQRYIPLDEYAGWIDRFVASIADRGATPVLVTAPPQYHADGNLDTRNDFDDYADVTRAYAAEHGVALIDLRKLATEYLRGIPAENRRAIFLQADPFQYASHPDGVRDCVHISTLGAFKYAGIIARSLAGILPWATLHDVEAAPSAGAAPALESVCNLSATARRHNVGLAGDIRWDAPAGADYYTVEKLSTETGRLYNRAITIKPSYLDMLLPGQSRHVVYRVTAWTDGTASEPVSVALSLPIDDDPCEDLD